MMYAKTSWQAKLAFYQEKALSGDLHLKHRIDITCFLSGEEYSLFLPTTVIVSCSWQASGQKHKPYYLAEVVGQCFQLLLPK